MRPHILVAESRGFSPHAAARLSEVAELTLADLDRAALLAAVKDFDVLWVRLRNRIDDYVLGSAPRLKMLVTPTTGLNHIDLPAASRRGIQVLSLRGQTDFLRTIRATAEHTIALILALLRHLPAAAAHAREGGWNRDLFQGRELHQKTVGIIGFGRVGRLVAEYLRPFELRLLVTDPALAPHGTPADVQLLPLADLLEQADIVTLHVNFSEALRGFFGRPQLSRMKKGSWFVNTARGELVDEQALLQAIRCGRLAGAALDVLSDECSAGMREHPLVACAREHENLIITPHIGGCTVESMEKTERFLADQLCAKWLATLSGNGPCELGSRG